MSEPELPVFPRIVPKTDPLSYVFLGLAISIAGACLLLAQLGLLDGREAFSGFFLALGIVLLLDALLRWAKPWTRHKTLPLALAGSSSLALGVASLLGLAMWWPLLLIALGAFSLAYGISRLGR